MATTRIRKTIDFGNGWKQVVYLKPMEYAILNLFIVLPIQLLILCVTGFIWLFTWLYIKLPFMFLKFIYKHIKALIIKGCEFYRKRKVNA